jgi:type I restriction enzyme, R subunit
MFLLFYVLIDSQTGKQKPPSHPSSERKLSVIAVEETIWSAFKQIETYKAQIPSLFTYNELLIISDGLEARVGSLTADTERFMPWRTIEGEELAPLGMVQLQVVIQGLLDKRRLLDFICYFVVFEDEGGGVLTKKIAGYHQFHAVNRAVATTIQASAETGDRRVGVVWHTQGSGKSLTMAFYAGRLVLEPRLESPTIVVITDRNDLDDLLFGTFSRCHELLRRAPEQAVDRENLRARLNVSTGHVVFTTIQKFMPTDETRNPVLSDRRNIIVIADEAHRSQYDFVDGFARHMRDALLPSRPRRTRKVGCTAASTGARPRLRDSADCLAGGGVRRGRGHLRGGRPEEARHLDSVRGVSDRSEPHAAEEPSGRTPSQALE